jgi:hypothetical protein
VLYALYGRICYCLIFYFMCAEEKAAADLTSYFMRKSMEGDGAEKVYRRRNSKWPASLSKCKMIYMVMAIVMFIIIENKLLMMMMTFFGG